MPKNKNKTMYGTWFARGKRLKQDGPYRMRYSIYDMTFDVRKRTLLTDDFIKTAGLDNEQTFTAVVLSLWTDFGLKIEVFDSNGKPIDVLIKVNIKMKTKTKAKAKAKGK